MNLKEIGCELLERMELAVDSDQWRSLVNTEINLRDA
jgi:hypothetical protein